MGKLVQPILFFIYKKRDKRNVSTNPKGNSYFENDKTKRLNPTTCLLVSRRLVQVKLRDACDGVLPSEANYRSRAQRFTAAEPARGVQLRIRSFGEHKTRYFVADALVVENPFRKVLG